MSGPGAIRPETLGSAAFRARYGLRLAYMAGAMANGIASEELVRAMSAAGLMASFGAAGVAPDRVRTAIRSLRADVPSEQLCVNFIHLPDAPERERTFAALLVEEGVTVVEASAFMAATPGLVLYRARNADRVPNRVIAKVSRPEVAAFFLKPPDSDMLRDLVAEGALSPEEAAAASRAPLATDITVEADSGGHTDNQQLVTAFPTILALRDEVALAFPPARQIALGAAGGLGTPAALAAAFAMGADYVVTGSINQSCVEAGTSAAVKRMLADLGAGGVAMAPAADMFELGVRVQVARRGTLFATRAQLLYDLFRRYRELAALPAEERERVERSLFRCSFDEVWREVEAYWQVHDPSELEKAAADGQRRLALMFRWYLGKSSDWARSGTADRAADYQIWCGPAMGAFNAWARATPFAAPEARRVAEIGATLMAEAAAQLAQLGQALAEPVPVRTEKEVPLSENDDLSLRDWLIAEVAQRTGMAEDDVDPREPFESYAIDSAGALMMLGRLERLLGRQLSPTLLWNYPTIDALSARLEAAA
jgi:trans-AT polyketide synthase, acyltransferase and oxidoreductase domains